jgi:hypothetical protein
MSGMSCGAPKFLPPSVEVQINVSSETYRLATTSTKPFGPTTGKGCNGDSVEPEGSVSPTR